MKRPPQPPTHWLNFAACLSEDAELFFPVGENRRALIQTEDAKAVCRTCHVIGQCAETALSHRIEHGVWGGMSEADRRRIHRRRARHATPKAVPQ